MVEDAPDDLTSDESVDESSSDEEEPSRKRTVPRGLTHRLFKDIHIDSGTQNYRSF